MDIFDFACDECRLKDSDRYYGSPRSTIDNQESQLKVVPNLQPNLLEVDDCCNDLAA
jgi:hypothetical protein